MSNAELLQGRESAVWLIGWHSGRVERAIEDLTKDEVEHLVILLREVVDVLHAGRRGNFISWSIW